MFNYKENQYRIQDIGVGITIGEMSLLKGSARSSSVLAQGTVLAFKISFRDMYRCMKMEPQMEKNLWKHACKHLAENMMHLIPEYSHLTKQRGKLRRILKSWTLKRIGKEEYPNVKTAVRGEGLGEVLAMDSPMLLLHGSAITFKRGGTLEIPADAPHVFDPSEWYKYVDQRKAISAHLPKNNRGEMSLRSPNRRSVAAISFENSVDAPVYFKPNPLLSVFVYADSRVMCAPAEDEKVEDQDLEDSKDITAHMNILMNIPWIDKSGVEVATFLLSVAELSVHQAGHSFIVNKSKADSFYVILRGWVSVTAEIRGRQVIVATKGKGSCIGELGFLTHSTRNATITAKTQVHSLCVSYDDLATAASNFPHIIATLWFESSATIARGVINALNQYNQYSKETVEKWLYTWQLLITDDSIKQGDQSMIPSMFIIVFGAATLCTDGAEKDEELVGPILVDSSNYQPDSMQVYFRKNTRIMIPCDKSADVLAEAFKVQTDAEGKTGAEISQEFLDSNNNTSNTIDMSPRQTSRSRFWSWLFKSSKNSCSHQKIIPGMSSEKYEKK